MNITEARAAQAVITWVLSLTVWDTDPDLTPDPTPADGTLVAALEHLAGRSHQTLSAGVTAPQAYRLGRLLTGARPVHDIPAGDLL